MSTSDLKHKLIDETNHSTNDLLLEELYQLLSLDEGEIEVLELNQDQVLKVQAAQTQYKEGNILSQEVADKEMDEWLSK